MILNINTAAYWYDIGEIDENKLYDLVEHGDITPEEYEHITGREYIY